MSIKPFKTKATYSWGGDKKNGELGFLEGEVIEVLGVVRKDRLYGRSMRTKLSGTFPSSYVDTSNQKSELKNSYSEESISSSRLATPPRSPQSRSPVRKSPSRNDSPLKSLVHSHSTPTLKKRDHGSSSTLNTDFSRDSQYGSFTTFTDESAPLPPKHNDLSQTKFKSSYVQQLLDSTLSIDTQNSSYFGHSDFSATSAGSFMRHKEMEFESRLHNAIGQQDENSTRAKLNDILERNEKGKQGSFLKKIIGQKSQQGPSFDDLVFLSSVEKLSVMEPNNDKFSSSVFESVKNNDSSDSLDLQRTKTLDGTERAKRTKRVLEEQPDIIIKPHKCISNINDDEEGIVSNSYVNFEEVNYEYVDNWINNLPFDDQIIPQDVVKNFINKKFTTDLERARAIYMYLTTKFTIYETIEEPLSVKRMPGFQKISEIMKNQRCTSHQLVWIFYLMAVNAGLEIEIILGHLKYPLQLDQTLSNPKTKLTLNHSWICMDVNGEFRFVDPTLGNRTNQLSTKSIWNPNTASDFYYLTKPKSLLFTHTPRHIDQQHVTPPIDPMAQLSLPPLYPAFHFSGVKLHKFNTSMFHLRDFDVYQFELEIPNDLEICAHFRPSDHNLPVQNALSQIYHKNGLRIANIRGILPKGCPSGFILVLAREDKEEEDGWELLTSIPAFHTGKWKQLDWVKIDSVDGDLYIKEPKLHQIKKGLVSFNIQMWRNWKKMSLFTPSGKSINLDIKDNSIIQTININESGIWKLAVPDHKRKVWKVAAQWVVA
ncbi:Cyk3 protein [Martiniozyma asiatica (nom. inval.)]|nr:Cyk3 protein [Martiniozyma asiatica]